MKKSVVVIIVISSLMAALLISLSIDTWKDEGPIPQQVLEYRMVESKEGDEAVLEIKRMHPKAFEIASGYTATYSRGDKSAYLWISVSTSDEDAGTLLDWMNIEIQDSNTFSNWRRVIIGGATVYRVSGMGMEHLYYREGRQVIWIAAPTDDLDRFTLEYRQFR